MIRVIRLIRGCKKGDPTATILCTSKTEVDLSNAFLGRETTANDTNLTNLDARVGDMIRVVRGWKRKFIAFALRGGFQKV